MKQQLQQLQRVRNLPIYPHAHQHDQPPAASRQPPAPLIHPPTKNELVAAVNNICMYVCVQVYLRSRSRAHTDWRRVERRE